MVFWAVGGLALVDLPLAAAGLRPRSTSVRFGRELRRSRIPRSMLGLLHSPALALRSPALAPHRERRACAAAMANQVNAQLGRGLERWELSLDRS
jgi:hypothetical protein